VASHPTLTRLTRRLRWHRAGPCRRWSIVTARACWPLRPGMLADGQGPEDVERKDSYAPGKLATWSRGPKFSTVAAPASREPFVTTVAQAPGFDHGGTAGTGRMDAAPTMPGLVPERVQAVEWSLACGFRTAGRA